MEYNEEDVAQAKARERSFYCYPENQIHGVAKYGNTKLSATSVFF